MQFQIWLEATEPYIKKLIDPALLTFKEFYDKINKSHKTHRSGAYDWSLSKMTEKKYGYPIPLFTKKINGISFEFRQSKHDKHQEQYVKVDAAGDVVRINGEVQYYSQEELVKLIPNRFNYSFSVFDGEQQVAVTQDEWGCLLVVVAQEYRRFGLGQIITKLAWEAEPGKDSGGCTWMGEALTRKVHSEFVREYLQKGFYSYLVRDGSLTNGRVKQILDSVNLKTTPKPSTNMNFNDPENWLLYAKENLFILYDRKLKDFINDEETHWKDNAIKGLADIGSKSYDGKGYRLRTWGGEGKIKNFMLLLALSWAKEPLFVHDEDLPDIKAKNVEVKGNWAELVGEPIDYRGMAAEERKFRKTFDKYGEFETLLIESAIGKYQA